MEDGGNRSNRGIAGNRNENDNGNEWWVINESALWEHKDFSLPLPRAAPASQRTA